MQHLISKLKKEIIENDNINNNVQVNSYYKYNLNPVYLNHNENFVSKYDDKTTFYPYSNYNGNKYNLKREFDEPVINYKTQDYIPDTYYQYNLKYTDHKKMMLNNLETENEISNDFNRRTRENESGQSIQEIKQEDNERAESLKLLLDTFNSDINNAKTIQEEVESIDKTNDKVKKLDLDYHRPKINKAIEDIKLNKKINKFKNLDKDFTNDDAINTKKYYYRQNENNKKIMSSDFKKNIKKIKKDKENENINNKLMNIEDINTKNELKRVKENEINTINDKEYENKIRRKIILKKEIKNELDDDNEFFDSVKVSEGIKVFNQEDYNIYLNNLSRNSEYFRGNELKELNKLLANSEIQQLGLNTKKINNALNKINEHYNNIIKTQENTPIKSNK